MVFEEGPRADVLVADLHALLPVRAVRAGRHAPLGRAVGVDHRQAGLGHVGGEGGVPEDLLRDLALRRHRAGLGERHAGGFRRRVLLQPVDVLGQRVDRRRPVGVAAARDRRAQRRAARRHADAPLVHRHAVGDAVVAGAGHRQPRIGEAPAQRRVLLAVVHVAVDRLAVDLLHVVGEEVGDVLVGGPVHRHAQLVAVLVLELVLQVVAREQVGAEPVQVGELLVGQLVQLAVRRGGEAGADEVLQVEPGVGELLARAGHVVGQRHDLAVAVVRADQVGVVDPAVVDRLARLHRGLQLLDDVAFLDQVVLDLDAGDLREGLGQRLGLVLVGVIVSETTEISLTPLACSLPAASMNHFISAVCCSLLSVVGWNSLSIHLVAIAEPPPRQTAGQPRAWSTRWRQSLALARPLPSCRRRSASSRPPRRAR